MGSLSITIAQLCDHFEQRELAKENTWRSYATKKTYHAYLTRWILPHWRQHELADAAFSPISCTFARPTTFSPYSP